MGLDEQQAWDWAWFMAAGQLVRSHLGGGWPSLAPMQNVCGCALGDGRITVSYAVGRPC